MVDLTVTPTVAHPVATMESRVPAFIVEKHITIHDQRTLSRCQVVLEHLDAKSRLDARRNGWALRPQLPPGPCGPSVSIPW
ncbi:hypothetical protein CAOG_005222 [Capsaspora owczarzaki ATCC 30864]|uniref:Uncharacterized protein n=1 Tax=Capsaspora owczarzaki (strain ATCC 30864) TaxID=595528 RepID=A0A0D2X3N1_CAPO3|nr:hypothetical protein CAOG_005222 [Capsaspora owczarzaki ATCC 30864]